MFIEYGSSPPLPFEHRLCQHSKYMHTEKAWGHCCLKGVKRSRSALKHIDIRWVHKPGASDCDEFVAKFGTEYDAPLGATL
jgi:hypothetical protein